MVLSARAEARAAMHRLLELSGVPWRSVWTEQAGRRLHHVESGTGPPVVLIHGGSGGGANWFRMLGPLARHYRVCAPDLPGFGLSDPAEPHLPLGQMAADYLLHWMEQQEIVEALVGGTSFGGLVALRLAQRSDRVARLLLLDAAGLGRGIHPSVRLAAVSPLTGLIVRPSRRGTEELFRRLLTSDRSELPQDQQARLVDWLYATAAAAGAAYAATTLRFFCGARGQREVVGPSELMGITQPVAIVWGARDRLTPLRHAKRALQGLPNATLEILADTGHSPNWERPLSVVNAIHDLARRRARDPLPDARGR